VRIGLRFQFAKLHGRLLSTWSPGAVVGVTAEQYLLEGLPEYLIEYGIEYGIDHGAGIAQPGDNIEYPMAYPFLTLLTHRRQQVEHKEWRPEYDKCEENHTQNFSGLLLQPNDATMSGGVPRDDTRVARVMGTHCLLSLQQAR